MAPSESRRDADRLVPLVAEATVSGHSVLVFCSSRKQCESAAALIADLLPQVGRVCRQVHVLKCSLRAHAFTRRMQLP